MIRAQCQKIMPHVPIGLTQPGYPGDKRRGQLAPRPQLYYCVGTATTPTHCDP